ncbi:MAG: hypothetical protein E6J42_01915 [Chloroflexi bacterium]|nr:MAG: hypothetical protein E6J42_01915 [Chloroflexota bacterium]
MTDADRFRISPEDLRRRHDASAFEFECTDELVPLSELIGQDRAMRSLQFGLGLEKSGYNIFVTGLTGTGKTTAVLDYVRRTLDERRRKGALQIPEDWCYVFNFDEPERPVALRLPGGRGKRLREDLEELLGTVRANVTRAFASDEYEHQRRAVIEQGQREAQQVMEAAQAEASASGFALNFLQTGVSLVPMREGRPMTPEEFNALSQEERHAIQERQQPVTENVAEAGERLRSIERDVGQKLRQLDRGVAEAVTAGSFQAVIAAHQAEDEVRKFLEKLREFSAANVALMRSEDEKQPGPPSVPFSAPLPDPFVAYRCNVFVDNSGAEGPPIILEANPTWSNLFGRIERRAYLGTYTSDHTMLRAGSVQRANGGYLILNLTDMLTKPGAWEGLKRVIRTKEARLEDPAEQFGFLTPQTLRPQPVPVDLKLLVTGDPTAYFLLTAYDEEFWELFKVKADFDFQIPRSPENALAYGAFICSICEREGLRHFDRSAVARVVEHGSRMVDDQEKLSARTGRLRDVVVEADYWASQAGSARVQAEHVQKAIDERVYRLNLVEERLREMIGQGTILVDIEGAAAGQVNGLAILDFGDFSFGRPTRITARTYLGQRGVTSIDRESQLSGKIHDKGVLILSGYLGWKYAQDKPLSLSASISFEQGYDSVDGDSASLAELCAIISSLADAPIRQDLAITGSVNQKGDVQPIGGVNQKIEGFHDLCRTVGFTGRQGVVIPARNRRNLMLREDVAESARGGDFQILAVDRVDEALEVLTGLVAGERGEDDKFPEDSVHGRADARLREMGEAMRQFGRRGRNGVTPDRPDGEAEPVVPAETGEEPAAGTEH